MEHESLPRHDRMGPLTRAIETLSIAGFSRRIAAATLLGAVLADFGSGIIHWAADAWGSDDLPIFGRRLIRPFRIHHINPRDFLRRDFIDCNGDVALVCCLSFSAAWLVPTASEAGRLVLVLLVAFGATALPTNQVHQWAHQATPPRSVAWLQRSGLILSRTQHARHHMKPFVTIYCIATGWCNSALAVVRFFPRLERAIRLATGAEPRGDELRLSRGETA